MLGDFFKLADELAKKEGIRSNEGLGNSCVGLRGVD
jgi:hypothetical protein